ncbi:hypothetical protein ACFXPA_44580 [Amycolatopsis sp. NPDC059090]|uniref:hypothetical protein n=1 Tax=unclassified Amycolatopsis TaxID=2618356 RepID=UPI00366CE9A9
MEKRRVSAWWYLLPLGLAAATLLCGPLVRAYGNGLVERAAKPAAVPGAVVTLEMRPGVTYRIFQEPLDGEIGGVWTFSVGNRPTPELEGTGESRGGFRNPPQRVVYAGRTFVYVDSLLSGRPATATVSRGGGQLLVEEAAVSGPAVTGVAIMAGVSLLALILVAAARLLTRRFPARPAAVRGRLSAPRRGWAVAGAVLAVVASVVIATSPNATDGTAGVYWLFTLTAAVPVFAIGPRQFRVSCLAAGTALVAFSVIGFFWFFVYLLPSGIILLATGFSTPVMPPRAPEAPSTPDPRAP